MGPIVCVVIMIAVRIMLYCKWEERIAVYQAFHAYRLTLAERRGRQMGGATLLNKGKALDQLKLEEHGDVQRHREDDHEYCKKPRMEHVLDKTLEKGSR